VTVAVAAIAGFALLRARIETDAPGGKLSGAVYVVLSGSVCEFTIVPVVVLPPTVPLTSHVTLLSCDPVTTAWKACVLPSATVAAVGNTDTLTMETMVTDRDVALDGSASGAAVICTVAGDGANAGAVYTPSAEIVPQAAPVHPEPETLQEIARLGFELTTGMSVAV
jgi:hypothetical protein